MARHCHDRSLPKLPGAHDVFITGIRKGSRFYEVSLLPDRHGVQLHITEQYRTPLQRQGARIELTWAELDQITWSPHADR